MTERYPDNERAHAAARHTATAPFWMGGVDRRAIGDAGDSAAWAEVHRPLVTGRTAKSWALKIAGYVAIPVVPAMLAALLLSFPDMTKEKLFIENRCSSTVGFSFIDGEAWRAWDGGWYVGPGVGVDDPVWFESPFAGGPANVYVFKSGEWVGPFSISRAPSTWFTGRRVVFEGEMCP